MKTVKRFGALSVLFVFLSTVFVLALTLQEQRRSRLTQQRSDAHQLVIEACQDQKITIAEMKNILRAVKNFQKEYSEAVSIYGDGMGDKIDERLEKTVDYYYDPDLLKQGRANQPKMKRLLSDFSGRDILKIERMFSWDRFIKLCFWMLLGVILFRIGYALDSGVLGVVGGVVAIVVFFVTVILLII